MTKHDLSADVAAFLAKGGSITVCATGARSDVIERTIAAQKAFERGYALMQIDPTAERIDAGYAVFNGQGEALYIGA